MRVSFCCFCFALLTAGPAGAATGTAGAGEVSGTWALATDSTVQLVITRTGDDVELRESKAGATRFDYTCNALGKECQAKVEGRSAKVSMWFNGSKLVEIVTRGSDVTRRRFVPSEDGSKLEVEVSSMSSNSKPETLVFKRE